MAENSIPALMDTTDFSTVRRLQGADFDNNYMTTPQIEVSNIQWKYKGRMSELDVALGDLTYMLLSRNSRYHQGGGLGCRRSSKEHLSDTQ